MIDNFKEWLAHLGFINEVNVFNNFWGVLTGRKPEARLPWKIMRTAQNLKTVDPYYTDWSLDEVYSLFCDEARYYALLDKQILGISGYIQATTDYSIELDGKSYLVTNVPVRISYQTGRKYYEPEVVSTIQERIKAGIQRSRFD